MEYAFKTRGIRENRWLNKLNQIRHLTIKNYTGFERLKPEFHVFQRVYTSIARVQSCFKGVFNPFSTILKPVFNDFKTRF